jgi:hypothetical protein
LVLKRRKKKEIAVENIESLLDSAIQIEHDAAGESRDSPRETRQLVQHQN